jgi:hypothetical protein
VADPANPPQTMKKRKLSQKQKTPELISEIFIKQEPEDQQFALTYQGPSDPLNYLKEDPDRQKNKLYHCSKCPDKFSCLNQWKQHKIKHESDDYSDTSDESDSVNIFEYSLEKIRSFLSL